MAKLESEYKKILLKLSGEALAGDAGFGIDPKVLDRMSLEIKQIIKLGIQVGMVIGGGNLFRGAHLNAAGLDRVTGDHMGMLATVMNALAMRDSLERNNVPTRVMSAIQMSGVVEQYDRRTAIRHLNSGDVVIFSAGTGNPFFTTDSAACLRGIEINADVVLKATKVDGVYDKDPNKHKDAKFYKELTYNQVLNDELKVMDTTAVVLCKENKIPLRVFNMLKKDSLMSIINGEDTGTIIK